MKGGIDMKKQFISMACILAALVSCQKNEAPEQTPQENQPIKVTLTATIGGDDTKVSYVEEDNVLKAAWGQYDKVSLLALNGSGVLLSNDIFTAKAAGKTAEFEGTFTNNPETYAVYVYYPALTVPDPLEGGFMSPVENGYSEQGVLNECVLNDIYFSVRGTYYLQKKNADPSHVCQYAVMAGQAEMDGNTFTVSLDHMSYVIKAILELPDPGLEVKYMDIKSYNSEGVSGYQDSHISHLGWGRINEMSIVQGVSTILNHGFGEDAFATGLTLEGDTLTAYLVGYGEADIAAGNYWDVNLTVEIDGDSKILTGKKEFPAAKSLEPGKMYRLNLALEPES